MAASFKSTTIKTFPDIGEKITQDTLYWKHLQFPITKKETAAVTDVEFSPVAPYNYAVTSSVKVQVHSSHSHEVVKSFSRFKEVAYSGSFRNDGKLIVAGGAEGYVKIFDVAGKTLLRNLRGHEGPVNVTRFLGDNIHVLSGGDDKTVRVWDIPSGSQLLKFSDHQDYVKCGVASKASKDIILTGCYDHKVRLYDIRSESSILTVDHGHPVEDVIMHPAGGIFISAGGNSIKVWDALAGGRLLATVANHHKTVTSLGFCSNYCRLVSGSLDRHVKIYDVSTYQVVHTLDYPSAILSIKVAPDDSLIAVGMADGLLSVQTRRDCEEVQAGKLLETKKRKASYKYTLRTKTHKPSEGDHVIMHKKKGESLKKYDLYLKRFQHSKALDAAMDMRVRMKTPGVTISVMQELMRRDALRASLAGRDTKSLTAILKFLQKNISNPKFMSTSIDITNLVLELFSKELVQSSSIDQTLVALKQSVTKEVIYMRELLQLMGTLDTLFASTQHSSTHQEVFKNPISSSDIAIIDSDSKQMEESMYVS